MSFGLMKKSSLLSGSTTLIQNHDGHVNAGRPSDRAMDSARIRHEVLAGAKALNFMRDKFLRFLPANSSVRSHFRGPMPG